MSNYAYVTFVMRNDSFIPGALVFAYAMKKQQTKYDLVCLVSEEVSDKGIKALNTLYDKVITMNELFVPHKDRHERQDRPFLFTRFNAFRLGGDGDFKQTYEKIVLADADILPLQNYDELFKLNTPAGIINEFKSHCMEYENGKYIVPDSVDQKASWIWHDIYNDVPHGTLIDKKITDKVQIDSENMGINACLYVLKPSMETYNQITKDIEKQEVIDTISTFKWPEMQYLTYKFSGLWYNIDLKYASFNGYPKLNILYGSHFAGLKPWSIKNKSVKVFGRFPDYKLWYYTFSKMVKDYPVLVEHSGLNRLNKFVQNLLINNKYQVDWQKIPNLKHLK
jgi:glycogenin glucosyltransferase